LVVSLESNLHSYIKILQEKKYFSLGKNIGIVLYDYCLTGYFTLLHSYLMNTKKFDRITTNPLIMNGQPCIRGMRLTVRRVIEIISLYKSREEIFTEFPELEEEDIKQVLDYVQTLLDDKIIPLTKVA